MAWIYRQSNGHINMAIDISKAAIRTSLQEIDAIADPGTGYVAGDEVTVVGGTSTVAAMIEVLTVGGGGEILTARIRNAGVYTATPSNDATVSGGSGSGAEFTLTWGGNGWIRRLAINVPGAAQSAVVSAGGSGYSVGDLLTVSGGSGVGTVATFRVLTESSGAVLTVALDDPGDYETPPSNAASTTSSSGTGCTLTITWGSGAAPVEIMLQGVGFGTDEVYIGWAAFTVGGVTNIAQYGFTGFLPGIGLTSQPGKHNGSYPSDAGVYQIATTTNMNWWMSFKPHRIAGASQAGTIFNSWYMGFGFSFMTSQQWPYPLVVGGTTYQAGLTSASSDNTIAGIGSPFGNPTTTSQANVRFRAPDGTWPLVYNRIMSSGSPSTSALNAGMFPGKIRSNTGVPSQLQWFDTGLTWDNFIPAAVSDNGTHRLLPCRFSTGNRYLRIPLIILGGSTFEFVMYCQLDGVFWFDAAGSGIVPTNRLFEDEKRFFTTQNGQHNQNPQRFCFQED